MNNIPYEILDAAVEIIEIMKYAPLEIKLKLPKKYTAFFKKAASYSKHTWKYDISKKLEEHNMSDMTKRMLLKTYERLFLQ